MKRLALALAGLGALVSASLAAAADAAASTDATLVATGKAVFQRVCAPCHAAGPGLDGSPMLPGATALADKHKGVVSPYLEQRSDLTAEVIKVFVRNGSGTMPMFRKTEISDAEIAAVAAYFAASSAASSARH